MLKNDMRRELYTFIVISLLGFILATGQIFHWPLPNLTKGIEAVVRPVFRMLDGLLLPPELRG